MYVTQNEEVTVYDLGLTLFRDEVVHHSLVKEHLQSTLLAMVAQERRGEIVDRCIHILYMYIGVGYIGCSVYECGHRSVYMLTEHCVCVLL